MKMPATREKKKKSGTSYRVRGNERNAVFEKPYRGKGRTPDPPKILETPKKVIFGVIFFPENLQYDCPFLLKCYLEREI